MAIDSRLLAAVLPIAAATLSRRRDKPVASSNEFWEQVRAVAPTAVWAYILEVDAECQAVSTIARDSFDDGAWLKRHHPALDDVLEGLQHAVQTYRSATTDPPLAYVQGYVIQQAYARLGWAFASERPGAGVTTSVVYDQAIRDQAGLLLLGWDDRTCHRHWADPCAFAEQWRVLTSSKNSDCVSRTDPDMLARAGLHDAELELLDAEEE